MAEHHGMNAFHLKYFIFDFWHTVAKYTQKLQREVQRSVERALGGKSYYSLIGRAEN